MPEPLGNVIKWSPVNPVALYPSSVVTSYRKVPAPVVILKKSEVAIISVLTLNSKKLSTFVIKYSEICIKVT